MKTLLKGPTSRHHKAAARSLGPAILLLALWPGAAVAETCLDEIRRPARPTALPSILPTRRPRTSRVRPVRRSWRNRAVSSSRRSRRMPLSSRRRATLTPHADGPEGHTRFEKTGRRQPKRVERLRSQHAAVDPCRRPRPGPARPRRRLPGEPAKGATIAPGIKVEPATHAAATPHQRAAVRRAPPRSGQRSYFIR